MFTVSQLHKVSRTLQLTDLIQDVHDVVVDPHLHACLEVSFEVTGNPFRFPHKDLSVRIVAILSILQDERAIQGNCLRYFYL